MSFSVRFVFRRRARETADRNCSYGAGCGGVGLLCGRYGGTNQSIPTRCGRHGRTRHGAQHPCRLSRYQWHLTHTDSLLCSMLLWLKLARRKKIRSDTILFLFLFSKSKLVPLSTCAGLGGAVGYALGGLDWTHTFLGKIFRSQEQILFVFAAILFSASVVLHLFSIEEQQYSPQHDRLDQVQHVSMFT